MRVDWEATTRVLPSTSLRAGASMMQAFVICKNEEANVERCIRAAQRSGVRPVLIDSGSTDRTLRIARELGAEIRSHEYVNHCETYNALTSELAASERCAIIDADMALSPALVEEVQHALDAGAEAVRAPVRMVWAGYALRHASLYPPKPIAFKGGRAYFAPHGHAEQLTSDVRVQDVSAELVHDDRKPYSTFLLNQVRYGRALRTRLQSGSVSWRDRVRAASPLLVFAQPFVSYVLRRGFLDGRGGVVYALDRMIAEAILCREALAGDEAAKPEDS